MNPWEYDIKKKAVNKSAVVYRDFEGVAYQFKDRLCQQCFEEVFRGWTL